MQISSPRAQWCTWHYPICCCVYWLLCPGTRDYQLRGALIALHQYLFVDSVHGRMAGVELEHACSQDYLAIVAIHMKRPDKDSTAEIISVTSVQAETLKELLIKKKKNWVQVITVSTTSMKCWGYVFEILGGGEGT